MKKNNNIVLITSSNKVYIKTSDGPGIEKLIECEQLCKIVRTETEAHIALVKKSMKLIDECERSLENLKRSQQNLFKQLIAIKKKIDN